MNTTYKLAEALRDAATSLETIGRLAGKPYYGRDDQGEPIQTYMGHNDEVRSYAKSRAGCAREALAAHDAEQAQAAKAVPADLRSAAERTRQDLGPTGSNYPDVRVLLAFVEQALAAPTPPAPEADELAAMLRGLGFEGQCPDSIGMTLRRWMDGYAKWLGAAPEAQQAAGKELAGATTGEQQ